MNRIEHIRKLLSSSPGDSFLLFALAKEYESLDSNKEAIDTFEQLRQIDGSYIGLYYHLAHLYAITDQLDLAIVCYEDGIQAAEIAEDTHSLAELKNAYMNFQLEEGL